MIQVSVVRSAQCQGDECRTKSSHRDPAIWPLHRSQRHLITLRNVIMNLKITKQFTSENNKLNLAMSAYLNHATSPSTIHILSYGILTGTTIWHTFLNGPIAYKTLPRQQFGNLQSKLFPPFFTIQMVTGAICFVTSYYYSRTATYNELLALGGVTLSGLLNLSLVGPWTTVCWQPLFFE